MLDIQLIRENPDKVKQGVAAKGHDVSLVDSALEIDRQFRELLQQTEQLRAERNQAAQIKDIEKGKEVKQQLQEKEPQLKELEHQLEQALYQLPNIPADDVPIGKGAAENKVLRTWGEPRKFAFPVKDHVELGELLDGIDIEHAARVTGTRFNYLKRGVALLEFALVQHALNVVTDETTLQSIAGNVEESYNSQPFIPVVPPVLIRPEVYGRMARLSPETIEERYYLPKDDFYLIGSAEHTLGPLHMDETLDEKSLPIRYVGFSTCFRREAGSYGQDTHGILRVHQFDKVELESFTTPENSDTEQEFFVAIQEHLMQSLELPYRVVLLSTGDMGGPNYRQIDIETWLPGQNRYRETHSSDHMADYQARRLKTRVRRKNGTVEFVHMNDATAFAIGRTLIAILENYQNEDGSVTIPEVLRKWVGKDRIVPQ